MSNILEEEGYPFDYHLGISLIFWLIFIILMFICGILLFLKSRKTNLINQKELFFGSGMPLIGLGFTFIFIQIAVLFQKYYVLSMSAAAIALLGFNMFYIYYCEKNLVNLKKIPTIFSIFTFIIALVNFFYALVNGTLIFEFFNTINTMLTLIENLFVFILIIKFTKQVMGILRNTGYIWIGSFILLYSGGFLDHPPFVSELPEAFAIITPILFIIGGILWFVSNKRICDGIISYYNQVHICTIHRGKISKETHIYYCPNCYTIYCQKCFEQVIKKDGCWNCQEQVELEEEKWKVEITENNSKKWKK